MIIRLVQEVRNAFESMKRLTEVSEDLFCGEEGAHLFRTMITGDLERIDLLLNSLLAYLFITGIDRKGKVRVFIEQALEERAVSLREKQTKVSKRFEEDLPDPAISDDELRYVLSSVLDYAVDSLRMNGDLDVIVKSGMSKEKEPQRKITILLSFSTDRRAARALRLVLRLVEEVVRMNQGRMKLEEDTERKKILLGLVFPVKS